MSTQSEKLERFIDAVDQEIEQEVKKKLDEAVQVRKKLIESANDEVLSEAYAKIRDDTKKIYAKYVRLASKAELDAKRDVLVHREELANQLFESLTSRVVEFTNSPEYHAYLISSLKKIFSENSGDENAVVYLAEKDIKLSEIIKPILGENVQIQSNDRIKIGGVEVYLVDKKQIIDKTFDSQILNKRTEFNQSGCLKI